MNGTTISVSKLRDNVAKALETVANTSEPLVIFQRSEPKAALVDIDYFNALEEAVLDTTDAKEAEKAKKEIEKATPFTDYIKKRWGTNF